MPVTKAIATSGSASSASSTSRGVMFMPEDLMRSPIRPVK